jgi:hypothetical protein
MNTIYRQIDEPKVWARRVLGAYFILLLIGIAFYTGMRLNDLLNEPVATAVDIAWSALGALIVGFVFALFGAFISAITFLINDALNRYRNRDVEQSSSMFGNTEKNERRYRHRIHYTATH